MAIGRQVGHGREAASGTRTLRSQYDEYGIVFPVPVLSAEEVAGTRARVERVRSALGGVPARLDGLHYSFRFVWDVFSHPRVLDAVERIVGPDILLRATRLFYKPPHTLNFVSWHQDGAPRGRDDPRVPVAWVALSEATVANGCLRVVPGSHQEGLVPHVHVPGIYNLEGGGNTAEADDARAVPVEMPAGSMSLHHPVLLHSSTANDSDGPRIGLTATFGSSHGAPPGCRVMCVRGAPPGAGYQVVEPPPTRSFAAELRAYQAGGRFVRHDVRRPRSD